MADKKKQTKELPPPSREFMRAVLDVSGTGSISVDCELCNRTHFVDDERAGDFKEGELEKLRAGYRQNPHKYVPHSGPDSIHWGRIGGKQVVDECPCNIASKYEALYWRDRRIIAEYFESMSSKIRDMADAEVSLAGRVTRATEST